MDMFDISLQPVYNFPGVWVIYNTFKQKQKILVKFFALFQWGDSSGVTGISRFRRYQAHFIRIVRKMAGGALRCYVATKQEEITAARKEMEAQMRNYFPESLCERVSGCIVTGLTESV